MAKRFTDTDIWDKVWFMELSPVHKCLVKYVRDQCNMAGVWQPNWKLACVHIGAEVSEKMLLEIDSGKQFAKTDQGKIYCLGFIEFQYGENLNPKSPVHRKILDLLDKITISKNRVINTLLNRVSNTLQEEEEDKEEDKVKEEVKEKETPKTKKRTLLKIPVPEKQEEKILIEAYQAVTSQQKEPDELIKSSRPTFGEPYADLWNLFAMKYRLLPIDRLTDKRLKHLRERIKEPSFEFDVILRGLSKSPFHKGENDRGWQADFDWIIKNSDNYEKLKEHAKKQFA
jgi:hypothetical protein